MKTSNNTKKWIEFAKAAVLPIFYLLLVIAEHNGTINHWRGLDDVQAVEDNFSVSYAPDACKPIYPDNPAWKPLIRLIAEYSKVKLRTDKEPRTIARLVATLSTEDKLGSGKTSEWTAPSTPIVVFYRHWPGNSGKDVPAEDFSVVGTIGDLQSWIDHSKSKFHFLTHDIVLGIMALVLGYSLWHMNHLPTSPAPKTKQK